MWASPFVPARRKFTYTNCLPPIRRNETCPLTMSSLLGALPVMHCQPPGASSFEPLPKASSPEPWASVNVVRFGGGESQSRTRPPGESTARLPSISKRPTDVPANVAPPVTRARTTTAASAESFLCMAVSLLAVDPVVDPVGLEDEVGVDRRRDDDGHEQVVRLLIAARAEPDEVHAVGQRRLVDVGNPHDVRGRELVLEVVRVEEAGGVRVLDVPGQPHSHASVRRDVLGDREDGRAGEGDHVPRARADEDGGER